MPRTIPCPCPPEALTCVGDATGYGIFERATLQRVGREASQTAYQGVLDSANNVSCDGDGCNKEVSNPTQTTILEEAIRIWWTLFIIVECHVQCESTLTVTCVKRG